MYFDDYELKFVDMEYSISISITKPYKKIKVGVPTY